MNSIVLQQLAAAAKKASENAYCKYSHFSVGAAVLADNGEIYTGCNVENAAYGSTSCAEANAIANAVVNGAQTIQAVFIYTPTKRYTYPCGNCRQVISEFANGTIVYSQCLNTEVHEHSIGELLPSRFNDADVLSGRTG